MNEKPTDILQDIRVAITLGRNADVGLTDKNELVFYKNQFTTNPQVVDLGPFTHKRMAELISYLDRLSIHLPPE